MSYPELTDEKYQQIRTKLLTKKSLTNDSVNKYYADTVKINLIFLYKHLIIAYFKNH